MGKISDKDLQRFMHGDFVYMRKEKEEATVDNAFDEPILMPMEQGLRGMTASEEREYNKGWDQVKAHENPYYDNDVREWVPDDGETKQEFTEPPFAVRCDGQKTFRRLPVEVEGLKWTGLNVHVMHQFVGKKDHSDDYSGVWRFLTPAEISGIMESSAIVWDNVQRSWVPVHMGDTIIKGVNGEFYPVSEDAMTQTYEEIQ